MRLINAYKVVNAILAERDALDLDSKYCQAMRGGIRKAPRAIEKAPSEGAVNVVYCRDCVNFGPYCGWRKEPNDEGICHLIADIMDGYYDGQEFRERRDFCSRGVRKDDVGRES